MGEGTKYLILQRHEEGVWTERGTVEAAGSEAARRKWANEHMKKADGTEAGKVTLVAVPVRSFDPLTFTIETEVKLKVVENTPASSARAARERASNPPAGD